MDIITINEFTCLFIKFFYRRYVEWAQDEKNIGFQPHFHIRVSKKTKEKQFGVRYYNDNKFIKTTNNDVKKIITSKKLDVDVKTKWRYKIKHITKEEKSDKITECETNYITGETKETISIKNSVISEKEVISYEEIPSIHESEIKVPFTVDFWDSANLNQFYICDTSSGFIRKFETELNPTICFSSDKKIDEVVSIFEKYHVTGNDSELKRTLCKNIFRASKSIETQTELPDMDLQTHFYKQIGKKKKKDKLQAYYDAKYAEETDDFASSYEVKDVEKNKPNITHSEVQTDAIDLYSEKIKIQTVERKEMIDLLDIITTCLIECKSVKNIKRHLLSTIGAFENFLIKTDRLGYLKVISKSLKVVNLMLDTG